MTNLQQRAVLDLAKDVRAYLRFEVGIIRGEVPGSAEVLSRPPNLLQEQLASRDREISRLRARLAARDSDTTIGGIPPEHFIWVFGVARTGSSWLGAMMGDLDDHATWYEPYVGDVFGYAYYMRAGEQQRGRGDYILGDPHRGAWIRSLRTFVLEGADARFPELGENGYLVVKEPNGSVGAPLLVEALPEGRCRLASGRPERRELGRRRGRSGRHRPGRVRAAAGQDVQRELREGLGGLRGTQRAQGRHQVRGPQVRRSRRAGEDLLLARYPHRGGATAKGGREVRLGEHPREAEGAEQTPSQGQTRRVAGGPDAGAGEDGGGDHHPHIGRVLPRLGACRGHTVRLTAFRPFW